MRRERDFFTISQACGKIEKNVNRLSIVEELWKAMGYGGLPGG